MGLISYSYWYIHFYMTRSQISSPATSPLHGSIMGRKRWLYSQPLQSSQAEERVILQRRDLIVAQDPEETQQHKAINTGEPLPSEDLHTHRHLYSHRENLYDCKSPACFILLEYLWLFVVRAMKTKLLQQHLLWIWSCWRFKLVMMTTAHKRSYLYHIRHFYPKQLTMNWRCTYY